MWTGNQVYFPNRVVGASTGAKPITTSFKLCFPHWFQCILHDSLKASVYDAWYRARSQLAIWFADVHSLGWKWFPGDEFGEYIHQLTSGCWCFDYQLVHTRVCFCHCWFALLSSLLAEYWSNSATEVFADSEPFSIYPTFRRLAGRVMVFSYPTRHESGRMSLR